MDDENTQPQSAVEPASTGSADKLTPTQIANWKRTFPEIAFLDDEQVQRLRDNLQNRIDRDSPPNHGI